MTTTRIIQDETQLEAIATAWSRLAGGSSFCSYSWLRAWWDFYGRGNQLAVLVAEDATGEILGIAPLYQTYTAKSGRSIRFLGSNDVCSDYLQILVKEEHLEPVAQSFADKLQQMNDHRATQWDLLKLVGSFENEPSVMALAVAMENNGCLVHREKTESTWQVELSTGWDEHLKRLSSSFRRQLKKLDQNLIRTGRATLVKAEDRASFEIGWQVLVTLHQKRRKSLGQPGCFADPRFKGFLRQASLAALENGTLRLQWTVLDNQPLAVSISFADRESIGMYQAGADPDLMEFRPGHLQNLLAIQSACDEGKLVYDFLRGDEVYKKRWGGEPIALESTRIVSSRMMPRIRHQAWLSGNALKSWLKPSVQSE